MVRACMTSPSLRPNSQKGAQPIRKIGRNGKLHGNPEMGAAQTMRSMSTTKGALRAVHNTKSAI